MILKEHNKEKEIEKTFRNFFKQREIDEMFKKIANVADKANKEAIENLKLNRDDDDD